MTIFSKISQQNSQKQNSEPSTIRNSYDYLVIDGQNLFWRSNILSIEEAEELDKGLINKYTVRNFFENLDNLINIYARHDSKIMLLFDNSLSRINIRKSLDNTYKSHRDKNEVPSGTYETLDIIKEIIKHRNDNYYLCYCSGYEADDLTPIVKNIKNEYEYCLFISTDLDWARNVTITDHWFNYSKVYDIPSFTNDFGFVPNNNSLKIFKAIKGDKSDNIKVGVPGITKEQISYIISKYTDIYEFYSNLDDKNLESVKHLFVNNKERVILNYKLVDFLKLTESFNDICYKCSCNLSIVEMYYKSIKLSYISKKTKKVF